MDKGIWRIAGLHFSHTDTYGAVQTFGKFIFANPAAQHFCQLYCFGGSCLGQEHKKFLTAPTARRILGAQFSYGNGAQCLQYGITRKMPKGVPESVTPTAGSPLSGLSGAVVSLAG